MSGRRWTSSDIADLKADWEDGVEPEVIAARLDRTVLSVKNQALAYRLGAQPRKKKVSTAVLDLLKSRGGEPVPIEEIGAVWEDYGRKPPRDLDSAIRCMMRAENADILPAERILAHTGRYRTTSYRLVGESR